MLDEITYPFPNFINSCTVEVWEWINNFIDILECHLTLEFSISVWTEYYLESNRNLKLKQSSVHTDMVEIEILVKSSKLWHIEYSITCFRFRSVFIILMYYVENHVFVRKKVDTILKHNHDIWNCKFNCSTCRLLENVKGHFYTSIDYISYMASRVRYIFQWFDLRYIMPILGSKPNCLVAPRSTGINLCMYPANERRYTL